MFNQVCTPAKFGCNDDQCAHQAVVSILQHARQSADEDRHKEFNRARRNLLDGDEKILPPKPDSHAKWGSCAAMLARSAASHRIWERLHIQFPRKCPPPLSSDELAQLADISRGVDAVWAATCLLQKYDKTLGEYAPIVHALRQELASHNTAFSAAYLSELDGAEQRNLATAPSSDWGSGFDMIHCAALAHPRYRQGKFMPSRPRISATPPRLRSTKLQSCGPMCVVQ